MLWAEERPVSAIVGAQEISTLHGLRLSNPPDFHMAYFKL
jgi:hypothetical protein